MLNENLIQALTAYTSTLEQQLAALEARVAQLEAQLESCELSFIWGKMRTAAQEKAPQIALETAPKR